MSCNTPEDVKFHRDHLWIRLGDNAGEALIGVSDFAQKQLGKILFVDLPRAGECVKLGQPFGTVESYKVVSELIAPASGEVLEANQLLRQSAGLVNDDCYGAGWMVKIRLSEPLELAGLLSGPQYLALLSESAR